jgi:hypothetical protein
MPCYSGKEQCPTVKHVLLIDAVRILLFPRETHAKSTVDERIVDATPDLLPAGSRLLREPGFLAFKLVQVESTMSTLKIRQYSVLVWSPRRKTTLSWATKPESTGVFDEPHQGDSHDSSNGIRERTLQTEILLRSLAMILGRREKNW